MVFKTAENSSVVDTEWGWEEGIQTKGALFCKDCDIVWDGSKKDRSQKSQLQAMLEFAFFFNLVIYFGKKL